MLVVIIAFSTDYVQNKMLVFEANEQCKYSIKAMWLTIPVNNVVIITKARFGA